MKPKRHTTLEWGVYKPDGTLLLRATSRRKAAEQPPGGLPIRRVKVTTTPAG